MGTNWKETSILTCDCGKKLRYQYTIANRLTAEKHNFGIHHLKAETGFSEKVIGEIKRYLNAAERAIEEVELRLIDDWTVQLQSTLNDGLPLSKKEEAWLGEVVM